MEMLCSVTIRHICAIGVVFDLFTVYWNGLLSGDHAGILTSELLRTVIIFCIKKHMCLGP